MLCRLDGLLAFAEEYNRMWGGNSPAAPLLVRRLRCLGHPANPTTGASLVDAIFAIQEHYLRVELHPNIDPSRYRIVRTHKSEPRRSRESVLQIAVR